MCEMAFRGRRARAVTGLVRVEIVAKRLLQKKKIVSNKTIGSRQKERRRGTREDSSATKEWVTRATERILNTSQPKITAIKRKVEQIIVARPTRNNSRTTEQPRASHNHGVEDRGNRSAEPLARKHAREAKIGTHPRNNCHFHRSCGPGRRALRGRRERIDDTGLLEDKPYVVVVVVLRFARAFTEEERKRTRWSGGRWTNEWCVWRANERELGEGTSTKDTQQAMEGKHGGRAQRNRGERRGRMDEEGQDYEGRKRSEVAHAKDAMEEKGGLDHEQAQSAGAARGEIRRKGRGGVDDEKVYERRKRAKEEVELPEKGSRRRRAGWWGSTESRACRSWASIVARIRTLAQHQRNATLPTGVCEGTSIVGGCGTDVAVRAHVHARRRTPVKTGSACRCARTSTYRWALERGERGVYGRRCEDGLAEYGRVVAHAARTRSHGAPRAVAWAWVGRSKVLCPTRLARRFERHGSRIDRWVSGLRDEKMTRCNAFPVPSIVRKYDEWTSSESVEESRKR
ncbi:hypothetical protein DFH08DRAFT_825957 [Mycena albidolilacea]|uniref:Uncharacterized protein n=1 Tax=Mycena albidolilacea TaxID=1033008 RepID=A0AAD7E9D7_9AGAR|nr:hypothetical protein DFH08DRAFT_825957 [Mycena albidolilacea]